MTETAKPGSKPIKAKNERKGKQTQQTRQQMLDELIMGTNTSSITSKRSVERLYLAQEQQYYRYFVKKFQRRAPLINRGYLLRMKAIDAVVRTFLQRSQASEPSVKTLVVNLGCGSDVLPWQCWARYPDACEGVLFLDVDYPELIAKKQQIVLNTPELRSLVPDAVTDAAETKSPHIFLRAEKYCQVGCDLSQLTALADTLSQLTDIHQAKILFTAEVSITYMKTELADAVIQWAAQLPGAEFCLLEQLLPDGEQHPFAKTMLHHFTTLKTTLGPVMKYPTIPDQEERFRRLGWPQAKALTLWQAWEDDRFLTAQDRLSMDRVEPFDEWEELALFAGHYFVLHAAARTGVELLTQCSVVTTTTTTAATLGDDHQPISLQYTPHHSERASRRHGTAVVVRDDVGEPIVCHMLGQGFSQRVNSCDVYALPRQHANVSLGSSFSFGPTNRMCAVTTDLGSTGVLLVGGRTSPTQCLRDAWLCSPTDHVWKRVDDMPVPLFRHAAARLGKSSMALVLGGRSASDTVSSSILLFRPHRGWLLCDTVKGEGSDDGLNASQVIGASLVCLEQRQSTTFTGLLLGGIKADGRFQRTQYNWKLVLRQDSATIQFTPIANPCLALARFGASVFATNDRIVMIGGVSPDVTRPVRDDIVLAKYDTKERQFHQTQFLQDPSFLPSDTTTYPLGKQIPLWSGHTCVQLGDDWFGVLGGGATCFSMGSFWTHGIYTFRIPRSLLSTVAGDDSVRDGDALTLEYQETLEMSPLTTSSSSASVSSVQITPIPRVTIQSSEEFDKILRAGKPAILTGLDLGPCTKEWSLDYLSRAVDGQTSVVVHEADQSKLDFITKNFRYVNMTWQDLVQRLSTEAKVYLRALSRSDPTAHVTNLADDFPELARGFSIPGPLQVVSENLFSSVLRLSGPVTMWLHYDVMANIYCQIQGAKRMVLFPPDNVSRLAFAPGASSSSLDVFTLLEESGSTDGSSSLLAGTQPHEALLQPGDILYLPPLWFHTAKPVPYSPPTVISPTPTPNSSLVSMAVNVFFRNWKSQTYAAGRDVYGNRDVAAYEKSRADIAKISQSLATSGLDTTAQRFYLQRLADELTLGL